MRYGAKSFYMVRAVGKNQQYQLIAIDDVIKCSVLCCFHSIYYNMRYTSRLIFPARLYNRSSMHWYLHHLHLPTFQNIPRCLINIVSNASKIAFIDFEGV